MPKRLLRSEEDVIDPQLITRRRCILPRDREGKRMRPGRPGVKCADIDRSVLRRRFIFIHRRPMEVPVHRQLEYSPIWRGLDPDRDIVGRSRHDLRSGGERDRLPDRRAIHQQPLAIACQGICLHRGEACGGGRLGQRLGFRLYAQRRQLNVVDRDSIARAARILAGDGELELLIARGHRVPWAQIEGGNDAGGTVGVRKRQAECH